VRFDESAIAEAQREFLIRLYNVYSFFVIYANIDGFSPAESKARPVKDRSPLDRWILAELQRTIKLVTQRLDEYQTHPAAVALSEFVDGLSNWYVRRSRDRFWKGQMDDDKRDAYWTLYECLTTLSKLMAPFVPFFAETMYQNLERSQFGEQAKESVHLCDWPAVREELIDEELLEEMSLVREIVALGRSARAAEKIKTRQPLAEVELVLAHAEKARILQGYIDLIQEELNVKSVKFVTEAREYVDYLIKPNFKAIGPKFGSLAPKIKQTLMTIDGGKARQQLVTAGKFPLTVDGQEIELTPEEVEIGLQAHAGFAAAQGPDVLVVLRTEISEPLRLEGLARELVHHIQQRRKEMNLAYEARIELTLDSPAEFAPVVEQMGEYIKNETLTTQIVAGKIESVSAEWIEIEGIPVKFEIKAV